jgi:DNA primase
LHKHGDRNPSASLNYKKLTYNCAGCQNSGGLLWFIGVCRGESATEARKWLNKSAGLGGEEQDLSSLLTFFDEVYAHNPNVAAPLPRMDARVLERWMFIHPYLTEIRRIPEESIKQFRVGYGTITVPMGGGIEIQSERIVVPHFWKGELVGWQTRRLLDDGTPKYLSSPDFPKDQTLFNYDPHQRPSVVVVESAMSVLSKCHTGINMVGTFGAKVTDRQVKLLGLHRRVCLWFDNDDAGWKAIQHVGEMLLPYTEVFVIDCPYAADPADLDDATFVALADEPVPFHQWSRPTALKEWTMGLTKHGSGDGQILPEEDEDQQKTASANWTEKDEAELQEELAADAEQ